MRSYTVNENHIGSAVSEILRYTQIDRQKFGYFYIRIIWEFNDSKKDVVMKNVILIVRLFHKTLYSVCSYINMKININIKSKLSLQTSNRISSVCTIGSC